MSADRPPTAAPPTAEPENTWHRLVDPDQLDEGRVTTVSVGTRSFAVSRFEGRYGCLDNACPHQGGPLGEGSIENGWLRCPWHGYDYSPIDGRPPEGLDDAVASFAVEVRDDGVYVALPPEPQPVRTVSDVVVETLVNWGVTHVFGMVGHSNLGFADAMRKAEARGDLTFVGIRHEGAAAFAASAYGKLTGSVAACFGIAGPGSTNLLTGPYDALEDRAPVLAISGQVPSAVRGRGAFQDTDLEAAFAGVARFSETVLPDSNHAELASLAMKTALVDHHVAHLILPDEVQHRPAPDAAAGRPTGRMGSIAADAVIAVDVGNNTYSFGRYFEASGHQDVVMSGYLGSIGFALPAAMGAWAAFGNRRQIVSISGDGGLGQYAMELTTAVKYGMNITHVVLDNQELGKISKEQRAAHWDVWQTGLHNPDFAAFARLCGAHGIRVARADQLDAALAEALAHPGPALVDIVTDPLLV